MLRKAREAMDYLLKLADSNGLVRPVAGAPEKVSGHVWQADGSELTWPPER